jgi:HEAT repeat protein
LARIALGDPEEFIRRLAEIALGQLPSISVDEARPVLTLLTQQPEHPRYMEIMSAVIQLCPRTGDLREILLELATSHHERERHAALQLLVEVFPDDEQIPSVVKEVAGQGLSSLPQYAKVIRNAAKGHPAMLGDLLRGNKREQLAALLAMPGPPNVPQSSTASLASVPEGTLSGTPDPECIVHAIELAHDFLRSDDPEAKSIAISFLRWQPDGGHLLVQHLTDSDLNTRVEILKCLNSIAWAAYRANDGAFQFTKDEGDFLVHMLDDPNDQVRNEVAQVLNPCIPPGSSAQGAVVPNTGPLDPANAEVFRRLLDLPTASELDWLALNYFSRVTPFLESDVERVARAIRRDGETLRARYVSRGEPVPTNVTGTAQAHDAFIALLTRFPSHPETRVLALELLSKFGANSFGMDAARYLLQSHDHGDSWNDAWRELVKRYRDSRERPIAELILETARHQERARDSSLIQEIVIDMLPDTWLAQKSHSSFAILEQVKSLLNPSEIADCERLALRNLLQVRLASQRGAIKSDEVRRLQGIPVFLDVAREAAGRAIASSDAGSRERGFAFIGVAGLESVELNRAAVEGLDDDEPSVRAAAADALGDLGVRESHVIDKLRAMVDRKQPALVRAAGLRNLAQLLPHDPETQKLVTSLSKDSNFVVRNEALRAAKAMEAAP